MKKWMAMLLALCMLCGMTSVNAEETKTVSSILAEFKVPANLELDILQDEGHSFIADGATSDGDYEAYITINKADEFPSSQEECFVVIYTGNHGLSEIGDDVVITEFDANLPAGEPVIIGFIPDGGYYSFSHRYSDVMVYIMLSDLTRPYFTFTLDRAIEIATLIFASMNNPAFVETNEAAFDSASVGKQPLTIGRVSFEVDENLEIIQATDNNCLLRNDQYITTIDCFDWQDEDIDFTGGDIQIDNCFLMAYLTNGNDQDGAINLCNLAQRRDIRMPDGDDVLSVSVSGVTMLCHYYPNMGFMMLAQCQDGSLTDEEMLAKLDEIALSFRVDGMTAEEMAEYKAQAEAELAAAKEEADRKAAEEAARKKVYIVNAGANIRSGPDSSYSKIHYAYKGDSFPLLGEEGNWYKIDVNGQTGYVSKGLCEVK